MLLLGVCSGGVRRANGNVRRVRVTILGGGFRVPPIGRRLAVSARTELDAALRGADVIFSALRPGGLDGPAGGYESVALALAAALCDGPAARLILNIR
jgi:hypothetical protein